MNRRIFFAPSVTQTRLCMILAPVFLVLWPAQQATAQSGERAITLKEAVQLALKQNLDVLIARVEEEKAKQAVVEARAPFTPQVFAGSGLAYTDGIPQSVEGANPSVVRVVGRQFLYNKPQMATVRQAGEMVGAAEHVSAGKQEEVAYHAAATYLDFERAWRRLKLAEEQVESLRHVEETAAARVEEGREIQLELSRRRLERARAEQQVSDLRAQMELLEATLRRDLNLTEEVRSNTLANEYGGNAAPAREQRGEPRTRRRQQPRVEAAGGRFARQGLRDAKPQRARACHASIW